MAGALVGSGVIYAGGVSASDWSSGSTCRGGAGRGLPPGRRRHQGCHRRGPAPGACARRRLISDAGWARSEAPALAQVGLITSGLRCTRRAADRIRRPKSTTMTVGDVHDLAHVVFDQDHGDAQLVLMSRMNGPCPRSRGSSPPPARPAAGAGSIARARPSSIASARRRAAARRGACATARSREVDDLFHPEAMLHLRPPGPGPHRALDSQPVSIRMWRPVRMFSTTVMWGRGRCSGTCGRCRARRCGWLEAHDRLALPEDVPSGGR